MRTVDGELEHIFALEGVRWSDRHRAAAVHYENDVEADDDDAARGVNDRVGVAVDELRAHRLPRGRENGVVICLRAFALDVAAPVPRHRVGVK